MRPRVRWTTRCNPFVRQWQLIVLLRRAPRTLPELATLLGCCQRTVRRDLYALQAVPLPITSRYTANEGSDPHPNTGRPKQDTGGPALNLWAIGETPEWPRNEPVPVRELHAR